MTARLWGDIFRLPRPWFDAVSQDMLGRGAIAGPTTAAFVLPQGVAFAVIAGPPPEYGRLPP